MRKKVRRQGWGIKTETVQMGTGVRGMIAGRSWSGTTLLALRCLPVMLLGLGLSACTPLTTDPTETTTDTTDVTADAVGGVTHATTDAMAGTSSQHSDAQSPSAKDQRARAFASANFDRLKEDMATGQGEHLAVLATLLEVPQDRQAEFFAFTQAQFPVVCRSPEVTSDEMITALTHALSTQPRLSQVVTSH